MVNYIFTLGFIINSGSLIPLKLSRPPDPGPTRLADPNRSPGRDTIYTIYCILGLSLTCSLSELYLYLWYTNNFCNNKNHLYIQKNYHRSGVHKNLYTYIKSHLPIQILIHIQFLLQNIRDYESSAGEHLSLSRPSLLMWNVLSSSLLFGTCKD